MVSVGCVTVDQCYLLQACFFLIMSLMLDKMGLYVVSLKNFLYYSQRYQEKAVAPAASVHSCSMGKICLPWQCTFETQVF